MKLNADCILCLLKRHIATAETVGNEEQVTAFAKDLMTMLASSPEEVAAPWHTPGITRLFTEHFGLADDRYAEEKAMSRRVSLVGRSVCCTRSMRFSMAAAFLCRAGLS